MTNELFNADNTTVQTIVEDIPADGASAFDTLVGEGKKYRDNEALARSRLEADLHIARLEKEAADRRKNEVQQATMQDILDKLDERARVTPVTNPEDLEGHRETPASTAAVSKKDLIDLVKQVANEERSQATEQQNLVATATALQKAWGSNWQQHLVQKQQELGLAQEFMNSIAAKSPQALLKLVGAEATTQINPQVYTPPRSQVANALKDNTEPVKNEAYWEKMYKENPDLYKSSAMTVERHKAAIKLGRSFFE